MTPPHLRRLDFVCMRGICAVKSLDLAGGIAFQSAKDGHSSPGPQLHAEILDISRPPCPRTCVTNLVYSSIHDRTATWRLCTTQRDGCPEGRRYGVLELPFSVLGLRRPVVGSQISALGSSRLVVDSVLLSVMFSIFLSTFGTLS